MITKFKTVQKPGNGSIHFIENQISELEDGLGEVVQELEESVCVCGGAMKENKRCMRANTGYLKNV